jgi:hypothetical protein
MIQSRPLDCTQGGLFISVAEHLADFEVGEAAQQVFVRHAATRLPPQDDVY